MNIHAPFHFAPPERRWVIIPTRMPRWLQSAWFPLALRLADLRARRLARRAFRRWGTPEEQWAYTAGMNRGAMLGILYCTLIGCMLVAGLWLAGHGL